MTTIASPPPPPSMFRPDSDAMNTLPDPRSHTPVSAVSRSTSNSSQHHPDLSAEVATLSTKLINAINHQTSLDDSLQSTRHELEAARRQIAQLEAAAQEHQDLVRQGVLMTRNDVDKRQGRLETELADERKRRGVVETEKKGIEQELENLTTALFEEANTMVAAARKDKEAAEKKSEQLKSQLSDMEILLTSHQEQLQDLKSVMQQMSSERDDDETNTSTVPSTPGMAAQEKMSRIFETSTLSPNTPGFEEITPDQPLKFTHLIHPVLRTDITAYEDFRNLLKSPKASSSRVNSGNFSALNPLGIVGSSNSSSSSAAALSRGSSSSNPSPAAPSFSHNSNGNSSPRDQPTTASSLKDMKFYKRALAEDIDPTLRLDIAPGISWLARRTVISSMTAGSLVVEPAPTASKFFGPVFACALCGENRKGEQYARKHRFRTSESDEAQRYPLCEFCLARVRATCDYIGFLRMVKDGHWRAETEDEIKSTWEESVKLRERMFWTRLGGGVVPAFVHLKDGPRSPTLSNGKSSDRKSEDSANDPFNSNGDKKRVSIGKSVLSDGASQPADASRLAEDEEKRIEEEAEQQLLEEMRQSHISSSNGAETMKAENGVPQDKVGKEERLSLTIPGGFNFEEGMTP